MGLFNKFIDKIENRLDRFEQQHGDNNRRQSNPNAINRSNTPSTNSSQSAGSMTSFNRTPALPPPSSSENIRGPLQGQRVSSLGNMRGPQQGQRDLPLLPPHSSGNRELRVPTEADRNQYSAIFDQCSPKNGVVSKIKVDTIFAISRLTQEVVNQIWKLADSKEHHELDRTEFVIAMHLVHVMKDRALSKLPTKLPRGYYEACTPGRASAGQSLPRTTTMRDMIDPSARPAVNSSQRHITPPIIEASSPQITIWVKEKEQDEPKFFPIYKNFLEHYSPVIKFMIRNGDEVVKIIADPAIFGLLATWMYDQTVRDKHNCEPYPHTLVYLWVLAFQLQIPDLCNQVADLYIRIACKPEGIEGPSLQVSKATRHVYDNTPKEYPNSALRRLLTFQHGAFRNGAQLASSSSMIPHEMAMDIASFMADLHQRNVANPGVRQNLAQIWRNFEGTEFHIDADSFLHNGRPTKSSIKTFNGEQIPLSIAPAHSTAEDVKPVAPILIREIWEEKYENLLLKVEYRLNPNFWAKHTKSATIDLQFVARYEGPEPKEIKSNPPCTSHNDQSLIVWNLGTICLDHTIRKLEAHLAGLFLKPGMIEVNWEVNKSRPNYEQGCKKISPCFSAAPKILMDVQWVRRPDSLDLTVEFKPDETGPTPDEPIHNVYLDAWYSGSAPLVETNNGGGRDPIRPLVAWRLNDVMSVNRPRKFFVRFLGKYGKPCMVEMTWYAGSGRQVVLARQIAESYTSDVAEQVPGLLKSRQEARMDIVKFRARCLEEERRAAMAPVVPGSFPDSSEGSTASGSSDGDIVIEGSYRHSSASSEHANSADVLVPGHYQDDDDDDDELRQTLRISAEEFAKEQKQELSRLAQAEKEAKRKEEEQNAHERLLENQRKARKASEKIQLDEKIRREEQQRKARQDAAGNIGQGGSRTEEKRSENQGLSDKGKSKDPNFFEPKYREDNRLTRNQQIPGAFPDSPKKSSLVTTPEKSQSAVAPSDLWGDVEDESPTWEKQRVPGMFPTTPKRVSFAPNPQKEPAPVVSTVKRSAPVWGTVPSRKPLPQKSLSRDSPMTGSSLEKDTSKMAPGTSAARSSTSTSGDSAPSSPFGKINTDKPRLSIFTENLEEKPKSPAPSAPKPSAAWGSSIPVNKNGKADVPKNETNFPAPSNPKTLAPAWGSSTSMGKLGKTPVKKSEPKPLPSTPAWEPSTLGEKISEVTADDQKSKSTNNEFEKDFAPAEPVKVQPEKDELPEFVIPTKPPTAKQRKAAKREADKLKREQEAKENAEKAAKEKEVAEKLKLERETKEAEEKAAKDKEAALLQQANDVREKAAKKKEEADKLKRDQEAKAAKEKEVAEKLKREQEAKEKAAKEKQAADKLKREQEAELKAAKVKEAADKLQRDKEAKAAKEEALKEKEAADKLKREQEAKDRAAKAKEEAAKLEREKDAKESEQRALDEKEKAAELKREKEASEKASREKEEAALLEKAKEAEKKAVKEKEQAFLLQKTKDAEEKADKEKEEAALLEKAKKDAESSKSLGVQKGKGMGKNVPGDDDHDDDVLDHETNKSTPFNSSAPAWGLASKSSRFFGKSPLENLRSNTMASVENLASVEKFPQEVLDEETEKPVSNAEEKSDRSAKPMNKREKRAATKQAEKEKREQKIKDAEAKVAREEKEAALLAKAEEDVESSKGLDKGKGKEALGEEAAGKVDAVAGDQAKDKAEDAGVAVKEEKPKEDDWSGFPTKKKKAKGGKKGRKG